MKRNLLPFFRKTVFAIAACITASTAFSQTVYKDYIDGQIWFRLKNDKVVGLSVSKDGDKTDLNNLKLSSMPYLRDVFTSHSVTRLVQPFPKAYGSDDLLRTYRLEFNDIHKVDDLIRELEESGAVAYAEKVPLMHTTLSPNDPLHNSSNMWGLFQINAEQAWNVGTGSSSIVVATVDNAIEITHSDLSGVLWVNAAEASGSPGVDDDGNGYVDDVNGYDVGDNDNNPNPPNTSFDHGTHVAGTTGAETNNNNGLSSIGFGISVMAVKSTQNAAGSNSVTNGYDGIYYAALNGADIINCSWGGNGFSSTGQNIVNWATSQGSIVVAAAGNDGTDNDVTPHYPSNYANAVAVASSTTGDVKSSFSNYGANSIDITAPGSNIASTVPFDNYAFMSGTSMASPMVSGLLGLMKSLNPTMPNADLLNCLYSTADNIDAANPSYIGKLGAGRINAFAAMNCVAATLNNPPVAEFSANYTTINAGGSVTFTDLSTFGPTTWSWNFDNQGLGGVTPATANSQGPHVVTYANPGFYEVSLTVTNANGNDTETKTAYIEVTTPGSCEIVNMDTTGFPFHFGWTPTLYNATNGGNPYGYVSGVNGYDDVAKVEYFNAAQTSGFNYMVGTYIWIGNAYSANPNKTVDVNVYDGTGGTVGSILATKTLDMAYMMANNGGIPYIDFDNAVTLPPSGEVFVGIDFSNLSYSAGDSLGIVTNRDPETSPSTAWEQWSDLTWHDFTSAWGINVSHYIMPWLTNDTVVVSLGATPTTICEGEQVQYDANGSTFQDTLLWTFTGVSPVNSNNLVDSVIYNTAGTYTTYLEVVGGGCGNYAVDSVTITVNPSPTPVITASSDTICSGNSVNLSATGGGTYLWIPGGSSSSSINPSPTSTTTYNVFVTTGGCTGNASKTIYVETSPTANATFNPSSGICPGDTVNFDGTSSSGAIAYSWSFPAGSPSSSSSNSPFPAISFGTGGTHSYSLQVSNSCGTDTYNGTVTINALPNVVANASPSNSICQGDQVTLTGSGATTYSWTGGVTDGNPFTPASTTSYTVTGTDANGCSNTDQITVTVNALPTVVANASPSSTICQGDQVTLTGSGASSYTWTGGVTDGNPFTPSSTASYTVTGTDANNCQNTDQITVTVNPPPTVTASASPSTTICQGDQVTLNGGGATSYSWTGGVSDGVPFTPTASGTYIVTGSTGSCSDTASIAITVNSLPTVIANASSDTICLGSSVTFTGSGSASSYTWDNGVTDGVPFTPGSVGTVTYTVTGTDANTCQNSDQVDVTVETCTGVDELAKGELSIFPNPTNNIVNIVGLSNVKLITLIDVTGKAVYINNKINSNRLAIDLSNASKGLYFLQIQTEDVLETYKVVKQ